MNCSRASCKPGKLSFEALVNTVCASVKRRDWIDIDQQRVQLQDGPEISYDRLVLALGGETPLDLVPILCLSVPHDHGCLSLGRTVASSEESEADKILVAIGAGYSGVELACKLADRLGERGRFRLIELTDKSCGRLQSLTHSS